MCEKPLENPAVRREKRTRIRENLMMRSTLAVSAIRLIKECTGQEMNINDCLLGMYSVEYGSKTWKTLLEWNREGYRLKINQEPEYIWGWQFASVDKKFEGGRPDLNYCALTPIYHEGQVAPGGRTGKG